MRILFLYISLLTLCTFTSSNNDERLIYLQLPRVYEFNLSASTNLLGVRSNVMAMQMQEISKQHSQSDSNWTKVAVDIFCDLPALLKADSSSERLQTFIKDLSMDSKIDAASKLLQSHDNLKPAYMESLDISTRELSRVQEIEFRRPVKSLLRIFVFDVIWPPQSPTLEEAEKGREQAEEGLQQWNQGHESIQHVLQYLGRLKAGLAATPNETGDNNSKKASSLRMWNALLERFKWRSPWSDRLRDWYLREILPLGLSAGKDVDHGTFCRWWKDTDFTAREGGKCTALD